MGAATLSAHAAVLGAVSWLAWTAGFGATATVMATALGAAPLIASIPGLMAGRRYTQQWLAIALVFYLGIAIAETIATRARSPAAIALLLTSSTELALLLKALRSEPPESRGSAEW